MPARNLRDGKQADEESRGQKGDDQADDLPACPLQGSVRVGDIFESFQLDIAADQEALLRVGEQL